MAATFYFYDLETSGVNPKTARIMQFAGQRTNQDLEPIGEPDNFYIKLSRDVLPEPDAILITGITPQKTLQDGITEAEFLKYFCSDIATPNTIFVGFNNIRFDDEFLRYMLYRNFYDPYEWHWKDGCGRWDMLDVVRMTRALRPEGITWPTDSEGRPSNRLELLTKFNNIDHTDAHTALSDVNATIAVARLVKKTQAQLFDYLLEMKDKKKIKTLVESGKPFVYVSGRYESRYEKLTIAVSAAEQPDSSGTLVYDLRYDPVVWAKKTDAELKAAMDVWQEDAGERLPFKLLQYNKCPSIAPAGAAKESAKRLSIDWGVIQKNLQNLKASPELIKRVMMLFEDKKKSFQTALLPDDRDPDGRLYDGFIPDADKRESEDVRGLGKDQLKTYVPRFEDGRLNGLFSLYKARNFPGSLSSEERQQWERHVEQKLFEGSPSSMEKFLLRLTELAARSSLTKNQQYLLEELKLYAESITPAE